MREEWQLIEQIDMPLRDRRALYGEYYQMITNAGWPLLDWPKLRAAIEKELRDGAHNDGFG